jgi:alkanesulfonate monooxygenase SsuD/methylene tetrahydromethanopterin reductase-like flavin-dependent oxidoreductase (luciferase family)
MVKVSIGIIGMERLYGGDFAGVVGAARMADDAGIDMLSITDHVVMGEHIEKYPYGPFPMPLDYPWFEPLTVLAAVAGSTTNIRLSTGILISPLRPAVLLAKQLATLDVMSRGRVTIGLGIGWQREEYDASGLPWDTRYKQFDEKIYAYPRPVQPTIPMWFGLKPTEKNFARIARYGNGWIPMDRKPEVIAGHAETMRAAFKAAGRDPKEIEIRVGVRPAVAPGKDRPDLDETFATIPALIEAGATTLEFIPSVWCKTPDELPAFFKRLTAWRDSTK